MNYYCYSIKKGLFDQEMEYAKDLGIYIFYDEEKDLFFNKDGILFDIKDKKIFPRTGVLEAKSLVDGIIKHRGIPLVTNEDYEKTLNWPNYIKTIRNNIILSGKQILENPDIIKEIFRSGKVFFKTKDKNFSDVIEVSNLFNQNSAFLKAIKEHENEEFIISDVVSIDKDKNDILIEYRTFIMNGQIMNISRVSDHLLETIPEEILDKLNNILISLKETDFPTSFVIDLFVYSNPEEKRVVDVLECNPIISSGLYLYNSVFEYQEDLLHKCPSASIPKEKLVYGQTKHYGFNITEKLRKSIYYNLPGGFAADLTAFALFGKKSSKGMYFHFYSGNSSLLNLNSLMEECISSDSDLIDNQNESEPKKLKKEKK